MIHLYRHDDLIKDLGLIKNTLEKKCEFKGIPVPTMEYLENKPERVEIETEWKNMLAHQLPLLPSFDQFWLELPAVFKWLYSAVEKTVRPSIPVMGVAIDKTWRPPAMATAWYANAPLEAIRFAGANRLCVDLTYNNTHDDRTLFLTADNGRETVAICSEASNRRG